jgi:hypothetical protein
VSAQIIRSAAAPPIARVVTRSFSDLTGLRVLLPAPGGARCHLVGHGYERAKAVRQACPQVLRTFKVSNLFKAAAALNYRAHGVSFDNHVQGEAAFQACMSLASRGCRSLGRGWGRV